MSLQARFSLLNFHSIVKVSIVVSWEAYYACSVWVGWKILIPYEISQYFTNYYTLFAAGMDTVLHTLYLIYTRSILQKREKTNVTKSMDKMEKGKQSENAMAWLDTDRSISKQKHWLNPASPSAPSLYPVFKCQASP